MSPWSSRVSRLGATERCGGITIGNQADRPTADPLLGSRVASASRRPLGIVKQLFLHFTATEISQIDCQIVNIIVLRLLSRVVGGLRAFVHG